jgi:WD40 repeat protein
MLCELAAMWVRMGMGAAKKSLLALSLPFLVLAAPKVSLCQVRNTIKGHGSTVYSVAFAPDRMTLAASGHDGRVKLWHVDTGKEAASLTGLRIAAASIAFSPDGQTLATTGFEEPVRLWDVATRKVRTELSG